MIYLVYDNLHCTNNEELRSEHYNNCVTINHDEEKSDKLFNSEENYETLTIICDEKKTDELFNSEENNQTETMNNENKAEKSENTINTDNSIIENIRTGIKTSNLRESSIDNI